MENTWLPALQLSTFPDHQHSKDIKHLCLRIYYLIFLKQHQKTLWETSEESWTMLNTQHLWRVEADTTSMPARRSSKGLMQPLRRRLSWGHVGGDLNAKWGREALHVLLCRGSKGHDGLKFSGTLRYLPSLTRGLRSSAAQGTRTRTHT